MQSSNRRKVLLIGWDAADWRVIRPLLENGQMPHLQSLIDRGVMGNMTTLQPVFSPMLWTSISTGKRPFKHGVLGFTEPSADGGSVQPVTILSRRTKALWNILSQQGKHSNVVGWWPSHPAEPIRGVMVSNHYQREGSLEQGWPMEPGCVSQPRLANELAELRFHPAEFTTDHVEPFIPRIREIDLEKDKRPQACLKVMAHCTSIHSAATFLMEHEPWDFMAVYYDAIDHFCHGFMQYHPPRQANVSEADYELYRDVVAAGYRYHDMMLGRLLELAGDETHVILMSDHGFHPDHLRPSAIPMEPAGPAAEHRDLGILVLAGPSFRQDDLVHGANLLDIAPTILSVFDLPVGEDMDGRVLAEAFVEPPQVEFIESWDAVDGDSGQHPPDSRLDPQESQAALDQLVALGYIDRPPEDQAQAVAETVREQDYNLAVSYMDAGLMGEAAPILARLYSEYPLEFRFAFKLAVCLQGLGALSELGELVDDLNSRVRHAVLESRRRLREIAELGKERRRQRKETTAEPTSDASERSADHTADKTEPLSVESGDLGESETESQVEEDLAAGEDNQEPVFNSAERETIRRLQALATANLWTLDVLAGYAAMGLQDHERALECFSRVRDAAVERAALHLQVGEAYLRLGRWDDALECGERVLRSDPEHAEGHLMRARALLGAQQHSAAADAARQAVALRFHFPAAHFYRGLATIRLGQTEPAVAMLKQAIAQNPNFPEAHILLARIFRRDYGELDASRHHRQIARQIRRERLERAAQRILPVLQPADGIVWSALIPDLPEPSELPANASKVASLSEPPQGHRLEPDTDDTAISTTDDSAIVVVSGLPRSGTSMMMQMLQSGGLRICTDHARQADDSNPRGYLEHQRVKQLATDNSWFQEARGQAIKVVAQLVPHLPSQEQLKLIIMDRDLEEILESQQQMLDRQQQSQPAVSRGRLRKVLEHQIQHVQFLLVAHRVPTLVVSYHETIARPAEVATAVADFLGLDLDRHAMAAAVSPELHRVRRQPDGDSSEMC